MIHGNEMQFVEVELDPGESAIAEAGSMMYMTQGIQMETIFGDGSQQQSKGVMGALLGAGKRLITGESLFMTVFTNQGGGKQQVAFAAPYPGKILAMDLKQLGGELICQKDSFLAAAKGISVGIAFQRKIGAGLFGGEGFIMQKLEGDGLCFVHAGGTVHPLELQPGQTLRVRFLDGDDRLRDRVIGYAGEWLEHANLSVEVGRFVDSEIRVSLTVAAGEVTPEPHPLASRASTSARAPTREEREVVTGPLMLPTALLPAPSRAAGR